MLSLRRQSKGEAMNRTINQIIDDMIATLEQLRSEAPKGRNASSKVVARHLGSLIKDGALLTEKFDL